MTKTNYEKELERQPYSTLVYMCEGKGILHIGDKGVLIARLVEAEKAKVAEVAPEEPPTEPPPEEPTIEPPAE